MAPARWRKIIKCWAQVKCWNLVV
uniref:Uncharacterized protein n=1 Tax=Rhizophora mucronata TaxID=61149 RepID=A0A2P2QJ80_RHIMU